MDSYRVQWTRAATKEVIKLPRDARLKILRVVEHLPSNPLPAGVRKLVGSEHTYRLREGDYRIIYTITAAALLIEIIRVGHRKDVYDRLS